MSKRAPSRFTIIFCPWSEVFPILCLDSDLTQIKGVGAKTAQEFSKLNIRSIRDLLFYFPRNYECYEEPADSAAAAAAAGLSACAVYVTVIAKPTLYRGRGLDIVNVKLTDAAGGTLSAKWFHMPYLQYQLKTGMKLVLRGKISISPSGNVLMEQPSVIAVEKYAALMRHLQPVYPLSTGAKLTSASIGKYIGAVIAQDDFWMDDTLPSDLRARYGLAGLTEAVRQIHLPSDRETLAEARKRIVFEEFYRFLCQMNALRSQEQLQRNHFAITYRMELEQLADRLPYTLTEAQQNAVRDICRDMTGEYMMNRLVQGDVGSGKTIVAFLTMYLVALNHYQSALMAPTEVLAAQHYEALCGLKQRYGLPIAPVLLTGSMSAAQKREAYRAIESGEADMIIGTHALIQEKVRFHSLAYVITDEQHRFGVRQRDTLRSKGLQPHVLVMSATPIPRTLAMILYADLDISVINELPNDRIPIKSCIIRPSGRPKAYAFLAKEVEAGHQAYVICPMIDESEMVNYMNVTDYTAQLGSVFVDKPYRIAALHGRMKQQEKNEIMRRFAAHEIDILVSTTVIEVGIDVGNATAILIENADSFGLAQLHQLRGRVGRSRLQSYCILVDTSSNEEGRKRLEILSHSSDGFYIASEDLKMRGPGDFFGIRQSGDLLFSMADIYTDHEILLMAAEAAGLERPEM